MAINYCYIIFGFFWFLNNSNCIFSPSEEIESTKAHQNAIRERNAAEEGKKTVYHQLGLKV